MNQLQETISFLTKMNIDHKVSTSKELYGEDIFILDNYEKTRSDTSVIISEGLGYGGFYCELYFLDGELQGHGCYE